MTESDAYGALVGHLVATARAHHEATGGTNPGWAEWYAERLVDPVNSVMSTEITAQQLAQWLEEADRRYRSEDREESWPKAYAGWLLAELA